MLALPPLAPSPALVRPRAISPESGEALPLELLAAELLERRDCRLIEIAGGPGSGKSTALAHLAATLPPIPEFLDEPDLLQLKVRSQQRPVFYSTSDSAVGRTSKLADAVLRLAPWTDDDLIELLLAVAPQRCSDVMRRVQAAPDKDELQGNAALWRLAIDEFLGDANLTTVRAAFVQTLTKLLPIANLRRLAADFSLAVLLENHDETLRLYGQLCPDEGHRRRMQPLAQPYVQRLLAGQRTATLIRSGGSCPWLREPLPPPLIDELAIWVRSDADVAEKLRSWLPNPRAPECAQAATILFAADPKWRPADGRRVHLERGSFPRAQWPRLRLINEPKLPSNLSWANLSGANLSHAELNGTLLCGTVLSGAFLDKASLVGALAREADFSGANLVAANAERMVLWRANLRGAKLDGASLVEAELEDADLRGACFQSANLTGAQLGGCRVAGTDFTGANFRRCVLSHLILREALLDYASFTEADLSKCDLEGISLEFASFCGANLRGALLTGSRLPNADFASADLQGAGLADIHWEGADLRGANLQGCSFHLGSSRSGLVGSPYPGHGSKTGFYTDDYNDQTFKSPEEIRKANLCGADLRGANLAGVDFYLVDLRGAKFDSTWTSHLENCGAILHDRSI